MAKYLYFDGHCGISGDMTVAALLDLGADKAKLDKAIASLNLEGFHYHIGRKESYSIAGMDFDVHLHHHDEPHEEHYHEHGHHHGEDNGHCHHHEHRHLSDVYAILDRADISAKARELAKKIFWIVAQAEAKAHGVALEEVHFHEVGAIDSIVDIMAAAVLLDDLGVDKVIVPHLSEGTGTIMCQHGELPVPVPAVLNIAEAHGIVLKATDNKGEMVTPTGIAILAALKPETKLPELYKIVKSGIGLGKRDFGHANFLRVMIVEDVADEDDEKVYVLESNIDDCSAEALGLAMEKIFAAGAYDVHFEPCYMKKNRPAYILRAVVAADKLEAVEYAVFAYTTTIGLRKYAVERTCMSREKMVVKLKFGEVEVKVSRYKDIVRCMPEYESVKKLAEASGEDFGFVFNLAQHVAMKEVRK